MVLGIILIIVASLATYFFLFGKVNPPLKKNEVRIRDIVFEVEVASTTVEKARGLSFRMGLEEDHGMLFLFDRLDVQNFWMKDMRFPIDIIWISGGKVVGFAEHATPEPGTSLWNLKMYTSPPATDKVLEVNAGTVSKYQIKVGDSVEIVI